jgi:hypothetical protein
MEYAVGTGPWLIDNLGQFGGSARPLLIRIEADCGTPGATQVAWLIICDPVPYCDCNGDVNCCQVPSAVAPEYDVSMLTLLLGACSRISLDEMPLLAIIAEFSVY